MRHNPFRYGDEVWNIGTRVKNFTMKRKPVFGTVTNIVPTGDRRSFLVMVTWDNSKGVTSHLNGNLITQL